MSTSKIQLSAEEMKLVTDSSWILTKHRIIDKVYHLFGNLSAQMQLHLQQQQHGLPNEVLQLSPKISKGEQYEALPYAVLDYPRFFSKENVFAVRCFFWWGNYFSITLQLKGKFQQQYGEKIALAIAEKKLQDCYLSFSGNEFSFNLAAENYFLAEEINKQFAEEIQQQPFLKISYKVSFAQWDVAEQSLLKAFEQFFSIL